MFVLFWVKKQWLYRIYCQIKKRLINVDKSEGNSSLFSPFPPFPAQTLMFNVFFKRVMCCHVMFKSLALCAIPCLALYRLALRFFWTIRYTLHNFFLQSCRYTRTRDRNKPCRWQVVVAVMPSESWMLMDIVSMWWTETLVKAIGGVMENFCQIFSWLWTRQLQRLTMCVKVSECKRRET